MANGTADATPPWSAVVALQRVNASLDQLLTQKSAEMADMSRLIKDLESDQSQKEEEIDRLQKRVDELEKDRERDAVTIDCAYGVNAKLRKRLASAKDWCTRLQRGIEKMKEQSALDHQFAAEQKKRIDQLEQTLASWARARIERLDGHLESDELT